MSKVAGIDYGLVERTGRRILAEKSKDLRVLAYLSLGYVRAERWDALADVFEGLARLADTHLGEMFPERPRARQMALAWLSEPRFVDMLAGRTPLEQDQPHIGRLLDALEKLRPALEKHFPEAPPFPAALYRAAQEWRKALAQKSAATAPSADATAGAQTLSRTPLQIQADIRKAALLLIGQEPQKPLGYRLLRACRWDPIETAPPAPDGKIQLEGPSEQQRAHLVSLATQQEWKTLLERSEQVFAGRGCHLWLDLQRYSASACEGLGATFSAVGDAIVFETRRLMCRVPELAELRFADGTACCDAATREWLEGISTQGRGQSAVSGDEKTAAEEDGFTRDTREAEALAARGKLSEAVAVLRNGIRHGAGARENFKRTMKMGLLLMAGKQPQVAMALLESLNDAVEEFRLERWEPELAVEAFACLLSVYRQACSGVPTHQQADLAKKQHMALSRISRIDPSRALALQS